MVCKYCGFIIDSSDFDDVEEGHVCTVWFFKQIKEGEDHVE